MLSRRRLPIAIAAVVLALCASITVALAAKTSHAGWPPIGPGHVKFAQTKGSHLRGTSKSDELLGKGGSDTLDGEGASDVLWGDELPSQPTSQHDIINGGAGNDFIYTSHGTNTVDAGPGNDTIHAHYGGGTIDCGAGVDKLYVSHRSKAHYKITNCELVSFHDPG